MTGHEFLHGLQYHTESEVVESGIGQPTPGNVFGELIQHLGVLGVHGQDTPGDELSVLPDTEVPCLYPHHVIKHELQVQPAFHTHLGKHGFAMLGHHAALVTVEGHEVAVECLLGVLKYVIQLRSTPSKMLRK